jgi:hypothetical protein
MTQVQTSPPQYYVPAQQVDQAYPCDPQYSNGNGHYMNGHDQSGNESRYRWRNPNDRGNSKHHRW